MKTKAFDPPEPKSRMLFALTVRLPTASEKLFRAIVPPPSVRFELDEMVLVAPSWSVPALSVVAPVQVLAP